MADIKTVAEELIATEQYILRNPYHNNSLNSDAMINEDIEIQACLYEDSCHNPSIQKHFADGAEWAKQEIIEKACDFMRNFTLPNGVAPLYDYVGNLRKAMEE